MLTRVQTIAIGLIFAAGGASGASVQADLEDELETSGLLAPIEVVSLETLPEGDLEGLSEAIQEVSIADVLGIEDAPAETAFAELMELTVPASEPILTDVDVSEELGDAEAPADLLFAVAACGFEECALPGAEEQTYDLVDTGDTEDEIVVDIDGGTLETADPAHAPLPASVLFLGAALGALSLGRRARRRS